MQLNMFEVTPPPRKASRNNKCGEVLALLIKRGKLGVTFNDFPTGFRLGARIWDLRKEEHDILTLNEVLESGERMARYVLRGEV